VAAHVQAFLSKADLGVRMTGAEGAGVLDAVRWPLSHTVMHVSVPLCMWGFWSVLDAVRWRVSHCVPFCTWDLGVRWS
jgi:hypothetical protein